MLSQHKLAYLRELRNLVLFRLKRKTKTRNVFLVVGPLRGGGGKTPLTTKEKKHFFSSKEKIDEKNMNH